MRGPDYADMQIRCQVSWSGPILVGAVPDIRNCSALRVALLAEIQDGHTIGLVWQKCGLNPPLGFITANLTMIGDELSSFVIA